MGRTESCSVIRQLVVKEISFFRFPLESESRWIRQLKNKELTVVDKGIIFRGGVFEIVPSTIVCSVLQNLLEKLFLCDNLSFQEWDFIQSAEVPRKTKKWSSKAVESVEKYIYEADSLIFRCRAYFEDHFFGSLIIQTNAGTKMVVQDFLKSQKEGVDTAHFLKG